MEKKVIKVTKGSYVRVKNQLRYIRKDFTTTGTIYRSGRIFIETNMGRAEVKFLA